MPTTPQFADFAPLMPVAKDWGPFISFEGIEGCGKTTQIELLKQKLESIGQRVHVYREPGGTPFGEHLRQAILTSQTSLHPWAEAFLFLSSRAQLLKEKIIPQLQAKEAVLLDRYFDSSLAYQGVARGLGLEQIEKLHCRPPLNLMPHCTFYLHIPAALSAQRVAHRGAQKDYFEKEQRHFTQKLIEGYQQAQRLHPERICTLDGSRSIEDISHQLWQKLGRVRPELLAC